MAGYVTYLKALCNCFVRCYFLLNAGFYVWSIIMKGFPRKAWSRVHGPRAEERSENVAVTFHKSTAKLTNKSHAATMRKP